MVSPESASGEVPSLQISELGSATQVDLYPQDSLSTDKRPSMSPLKTVGSPKIGYALTYEHSQYGTPALSATVEGFSLHGIFPCNATVENALKMAAVCLIYVVGMVFGLAHCFGGFR